MTPNDSLCVLRQNLRRQPKRAVPRLWCLLKHYVASGRRTRVGGSPCVEQRSVVSRGRVSAACVANVCLVLAEAGPSSSASTRATCIAPDGQPRPPVELLPVQ
eukprot:CAMPEP_0196681222 /NCGR_PEP_ID=MMETSP1090-20130531/8343_1 /TAXON_ID=37098 /ORGANISM="Isochrysis sp, Strain CCMP1244" /LENGTH=102 /DNA_ID=CAMNT_0042019567 /DNA_START=79 /DNA_END=384 /DNA_ORIENTATION=+